MCRFPQFEENSYLEGIMEARIKQKHCSASEKGIAKGVHFTA